MPVGKGCGFPAPWSPDDESLLDEERLIDLFERTLVLPNCRRYGVGSDRSTVELCDYGPENLVVNGRKLEKIQLPAYISVVILARHEDDKYKYVLRGDGCSARVPFGYFDGVDEIDNDIMLVLQELEWVANKSTTPAKKAE